MQMTQIGVAAGLLLSVAAAQASVVISDDFSLTGTGRTAGAALNNTYTPDITTPTTIAGVQWTASAGVKFGGDSSNGTAAFTSSSSLVAAIAAPKNADTLQVSMDVHPTFLVGSSGKTSGWIAVGMGSVNNSQTWTGGMYLLLLPVDRTNPTRTVYKYQLFDNTNALIIQGDTLVNVADTATVKLTLTYAASTNSISASWNSTAIVTNYSLSSFTPTINYVGFSSAGVDSTAFGDNFAVDATSVPEPANIGLLTLAGLAMLSTTKKSRL